MSNPDVVFQAVSTGGTEKLQESMERGRGVRGFWAQGGFRGERCGGLGDGV